MSPDIAQYAIANSHFLRHVFPSSTVCDGWEERTVNSKKRPTLKNKLLLWQRFAQSLRDYEALYRVKRGLANRLVLQRVVFNQIHSLSFCIFKDIFFYILFPIYHSFNLLVILFTLPNIPTKLLPPLVIVFQY